MPDYQPAGIVHHGEWIHFDEDGVMAHFYWDEEVQKTIPHYYTKREWAEMLEDD